MTPAAEAKKPIVYTIVNPSDPYTLVARDREVAGLACILLGEGQYALHAHDEHGQELGNEHGIPLMMFDRKPDDTWRTLFGGELDIGDRITARAAEIVEVLDTVSIGRYGDRAEYEAALEMIDDPAKKRAWIERRQEQRRSSMNNIGRRALQIADALRRQTALPPTPQSVFVVA